MSSSATLSWDTDEGVSAEEWASFCKDHRVTYSPSTVGGNVFYAGDVEFHFGKIDYDGKCPDYAEVISVATFHFGPALPEVARLARELWLRHGGKLSGDEEVRRLIVRNNEVNRRKTDLKLPATIEFPGIVYLVHEDAQELPAAADHPSAPWVRGIVPGGELIFCGVALGTVLALRPDSEALQEMGANEPTSWVTRATEVDLHLDLGALLGPERHE